MLVPNYCKDVGHKRPTDYGQVTANIRVTTLPSIELAEYGMSPSGEWGTQT